ncbi:MAG: T9SS type A sorting domain-containing protein [Calditrichaeota bacterium]|nr:T9SS type A sorting domain-containing protein [Calditrichota bacterium]
MRQWTLLAVLILFLCKITSAQPYTIVVCNTPSPLPDSCGGNGWIPNGSVVSLWHDLGPRGVDPTDTLLQTAIVNHHEINGLEGLFCFELVHSFPSGFWTYIFADNCDADTRFRADSLYLPGGANFNIDLLQEAWDCVSCQVTGIGETPVTELPSSITLHPNYPNPFNPTTEISFELPRATNVSLRVFDLLGREVAVLVNGDMSAGAHRVEFNGKELASGVYFYRLDAGEFSRTRKMVLLK